MQRLLQVDSRLADSLHEDMFSSGLPYAKGLALSGGAFLPTSVGKPLSLFDCGLAAKLGDVPFDPTLLDALLQLGPRLFQAGRLHRAGVFQFDDA